MKRHNGTSPDIEWRRGVAKRRKRPETCQGNCRNPPGCGRKIHQGLAKVFSRQVQSYAESGDFLCLQNLFVEIAAPAIGVGVLLREIDGRTRILPGERRAFYTNAQPGGGAVAASCCAAVALSLSR